MKKTARNKTANQAPTPAAQRTLRLASVVRRNLYAFVIQEGMKALDVMLEQDREALCGTPHKKSKSDDPVRWGHTEGRLAMGGERVVVNKPRVRHQGTEVTLPSWAEFADEGPLDARTFEQLVLGCRHGATTVQSSRCLRSSARTGRARVRRAAALRPRRSASSMRGSDGTCRSCRSWR